MVSPLKISAEEIENAKTPKGAWTRETLAQWGVSWPPTKGWKRALIEGRPLAEIQLEETACGNLESAPESLEAELLHRLVMSLINAGNGHLINDVPEINGFYGCKLPTVAEIIKRPISDFAVTGELRSDDLVYRFSCMRPVQQATRGGAEISNS